MRKGESRSKIRCAGPNLSAYALPKPRIFFRRFGTVDPSVHGAKKLEVKPPGHVATQAWCVLASRVLRVSAFPVSDLDFTPRSVAGGHAAARLLSPRRAARQDIHANAMGAAG
eukprot:3200323-Prymnesium_polylepis.1